MGTYDEKHEVFEHGFEMAVAWDGDGAVDDRADEGPDEARHGCRPGGEQLQAECQAVDVGAVVGDDAEREDDETEFAKSAEGWEEHGSEESTDPGLRVAVYIGSVGCVEGGSCDGEAEHFGEAEGKDEAGVCPCEGFHPRDGDWLVDGVIGRVASPACAEAEDGGCE